MPTLETWKGVYLWNYIPSLPLAITFAILFGLVTTILAWKTFKTRTWFCLPFVIGGICAFKSLPHSNFPLYPQHL